MPCYLPPGEERKETKMVKKKAPPLALLMLAERSLLACCQQSLAIITLPGRVSKDAGGVTVTLGGHQELCKAHKSYMTF